MEILPFAPAGLIIAEVPAGLGWWDPAGCHCQENQRPCLHIEKKWALKEKITGLEKSCGSENTFQSVCFTNFCSYLCSLFAGSSIPIQLLGCFIWIFIICVNHCIFGHKIGVLWLRGDIYLTGSDLISCLETSAENKMSWGVFFFHFLFLLFLKTADLQSCS